MSHLLSRCYVRAGVAISLMSFALVAAFAATAAEQGVTVTNSWFRFIMSARPAAGYFTLSNDSGTPRVLVGAASPACGTLMLHRSLPQGGHERMVMVKSASVPAHGEVKFAPNGYHLMCMSPSKDMAPGHSVPVTLRFQDGATLAAEFPVRSPSPR